MEPNAPNQPVVDDNVNGDSHFIKISIRAWIALILVVATCVMSIMAKDVKEPMYSLVTLAVGFYFGQKLK
jgi:hypothetical protein